MSTVVSLLVVAAIILLSVLVGRWWQRRDGTVKRVDAADGHHFEPEQLAAVGLDVEGAEALALLLGSPTCAPCETVKGVLAEVEDERPGLHWTYVDAADHLELARSHHVMRVPTLFVLEPGGRILARTSGVPGRRDLLRVLDREGEFV